MGSRLGTVLRTGIFSAVISAPWILIGTVVGGKIGALATAGFCLLALHLAYRGSSLLLIRYYQAKPLTPNHPVVRTFRQLSASRNSGAQLLVYPDPWPNLFVARGSDSKIFLSSGLLETSNEAALRKLLSECLTALKNPSLGLMTWSAACYCTLRRFQPGKGRTTPDAKLLQGLLWLIRAPLYALFSYLRGKNELFPRHSAQEITADWSREPGFTHAALEPHRDLYPLCRWNDPGVRELLRI